MVNICSSPPKSPKTSFLKSSLKQLSPTSPTTRKKKLSNLSTRNSLLAVSSTKTFPKPTEDGVVDVRLYVE